MKKALILAIGFLLVLAGCALQGSGTGRISLGLPTIAPRVADAGVASVARLSLYRFGAALPLEDGKTELEFALDGNRKEITGLQAGPGYRIAISLGSKDATGFFKPAQYGTSDEFSVVSDAAAAVNLVLAKSPFTWLTTAASSVAVVGGEVWLYSANSLRRLDVEAAPFSLADPLSGRTVNSISAGLAFSNAAGADNAIVPRLWLNTSDGIVPYADGVPQLGFMRSGMADVTYSTALTMKPDAKSKTKLVAFFSGYKVGDRTKSNMGGVATDDPAVWEWQDLAGNIASMGEFADVLSEADVLKSVAVGDGFYYIATSLNTFRIDNALMASFTAGTDVTSFITNKVLNGADTVISVPNETIVHVATAGGFLYAGTKHGLYAATIDSLGKPGSFTLIGGGKATDRVTGLVAVKYGADAYAAAVTADGKLVLAKNGALQKSYDSMAGVPGKAVPSFWASGTGLTLFLAGSDSAVRMTVAGPLN